MTLRDRLLKSHVTLSESWADRLSKPTNGMQTVEVFPPSNRDVPATLYRFVKGITEYQTAWLGLKNRSPVSAYELRRDSEDRLRLQFSVPNQRLERKIRTQLSDSIPGVGFDTGVNGLPVSQGDSVGGGYLTTGKTDWYPLQTDFESPPINALISILHRHAMTDSRIAVQILFRPVNRRSLGSRRWARRARKEAHHLRGDNTERVPAKQRSATPMERRTADRIEEKVGSSRFKTVIRILVIGGGKATFSHVKEISGGFNVFEAVTGQYLETRYLRTSRDSRVLRFAEAVRDRKFRGWGLPFQVSDEELAALVSIPGRDQENIQYAAP